MTNMETVLNAITAGATSNAAVCAATSLKPRQVKSALQNLRKAGKINGQGLGITEQAKAAQPPLQQVWSQL